MVTPEPATTRRETLPPESTESKVAIFAAMAANMGIAISKFVAFMFTGSSSMLSEAIHSVADTGNQVLLLIGGRHAKAGASKEHQFGRTGVRYVYGFLVSVIIFTAGGIFSLYEGVHKIQHPEPLKNAPIAIGVLLFALLLEGFSLRTALKEAKGGRGNRSLYRYLRRSRDPELPVVIMEDFGALLGLGLAFVAISLNIITGNGVWDGVGSICIGLLLISAAAFLATETGSLLIGESALPEEQEAIRSALSDGVVLLDIIHLRTLHVGPQVLLVAAKVSVPRGTPIEVVAQAIDYAEVRIREAVVDAQYIFIEPDIRREN